MATSMDEDPQPTSNEESRLAFLNGFIAMPLNMAASSMIKYLYFRPYKLGKQRSSTNDSSEIDYRTLYVTNLALNCTERDLTALFGACGTIESIRFDSRTKTQSSEASQVSEALHSMIHTNDMDDENGGAIQNEYLKTRLARLERNIVGKTESTKLSFERGGFALIVFSEVSGVENAMSTLRPMSNFGKSEKGQKKSSQGLKLWLKDWQTEFCKDPKDLQKEADLALQDYDRRQRQQKKFEEKLSTTQDNDGWTLVAPKGRKKSGGGSATVASAGLTQTQLRAVKAAQDKKTQHDGFYKFQKLDMKANRLEQLKKRFEQDKAKVRKLQQNQRKFTPM